MKKKLRILVILIAVLLVGTVGYYFMPKKFGKNVNPSEVDHINVFDGNTGTGFTITDSEDIEYIVANIQGISMKRDGISLGRMGYCRLPRLLTQQGLTTIERVDDAG